MFIRIFNVFIQSLWKHVSYLFACLKIRSVNTVSGARRDDGDAALVFTTFKGVL